MALAVRGGVEGPPRADIQALSGEACGGGELDQPFSYMRRFQSHAG